MAIKNVNELGFTVYTTNDGVLVGEADFFYEEIGLGEGSSDMARWAVRNGFSQALVDTGAGKTMDDRRKAFMAKVDRFRKNIVPADSIGGGRALTELERELRIVVETWLRNKGEKAGIAKEKAMDPEATANEIGAIWEKAGKGIAADVAKRHLDFWTAAAQKRVDDNKALGGADLTM